MIGVMKVPPLKRQQCSALIATALLTFTTGVTANPVGEQVIQGQAGFTRSGSNLIITQGSQRVIINWQDFSNANGELTKFIQPNSSAAALNRVISGNPSALLGDLEANGHIYLINPNGIVVGAGANINTQSFIASTLDVADADFMNGGDLNFVGDSQKTIENLGTINGGNGDVFLIAKHVDNSGTINAEGHVGLAGVNDVLLKASGDDRLSVRVTDKDGSVDQSGLIEATKIELKAANNNPYALAINHEGISRATSAVNNKGRIILSGGAKGEVRISGTLDASGKGEGETGGQVIVLGEKVGLFDEAKIDVSGDAGGGEVLLGGEQQGAVAVAGETNTDVLYIDDDAEINADAITEGDGGRIITWANHTNRAFGDISARGGAVSGDGGFVEISGGHYFEIGGTPDVTASNGLGGHWLIDPSGNDLNIVFGGANTNINAANPFATTDDAASLGWNLIRAGLIAGTTVTVTTTNSGTSSENGNINVNTDLDYNGIGTLGKTLTLNAIGDINFNNKIFDSVGVDDILNLNLFAGGGINLDADGSVVSGTLTATTFNGVGGLFEVEAGTTFTVKGLGSTFDSTITAFDYDIAGTLNFDDTDTLNLVQRTASTGFGIGSATCGSACDTQIDNAELNRIVVPNGTLNFSASSDLFVKDVAAANTDQINSVSLSGSGDIEFESGTPAGSTFTQLDVNTTNDVLINSSLTATSGDINIQTTGGDIRGTGLITANDIGLIASGVNSAIGSSGAGAVNVNATGIVTATASNGNGGIFLNNIGDIDLSSNLVFNSDTGDAELTAIDGSIITGSSLINFNGTNLTLTTTEDGGNNIADDRDIQIGTGGINASTTNITLNSADNVIVEGAINAASLTAIAGDGKNGAPGSTDFLGFGTSGGQGGSGGSIHLDVGLNVTGNINLTAGSGGSGGSGGNGASGGSGGTGGNGGSAGSIHLDAGLTATDNITLTAGLAGAGGLGGVSNVPLVGLVRAPSGGQGSSGQIQGSQIDTTATNGSITVTGAINADAGSSVSLLAGTAATQLLTLNTVQNLSLTGAGNLSLQGFGFNSANNFSTVDGNISINSGAGDLGLTGTVTASNGDVNLTSGGNLTTSQLITGNNIGLIASGLNSAIGSTGAGVIQTNTSGIITATASDGVGGVFLSKQGDFDISNLVLNTDMGDAELTAVNGNLTSGATAFNFTGSNLTLATTEDASNNSAGDRNIQIGSGGISASTTTLTFTSADDVIIDGAITAASVTATAGDGKDGVGTFAAIDDPNPLNSGATGNHGERGGDIIVNQSITSTVGDIELTAGAGGNGAVGVTGTGDGADNPIGTGGNSGGSGGTGGAGGSISINATLTAEQDIQLTAGNGGTGGFGGDGNDDGGDGDGIGGNSGGTGGAGGAGGSISINAALMAEKDIRLIAGSGGDGSGGRGNGKGGDGNSNGGNSGGTGGTGGAGGSISINAALTAKQDIQLTAGHGGNSIGGDGNDVGGISGGARSGNSGGTGGTGGAGGSISINAALMAEQDIQLTAGNGGNSIGGDGGGIGGTGGAGGAGGSISINAALTAEQDIQLSAGNGSVSDGGNGIIDGSGGADGADGAITGNNINATATNGSITVNGAIDTGTDDVILNAGNQLNISDLVTANNISLTATGTNAAIGMSGSAIQTNASGIISANANNGTGGIFISNQGDLQIGNIDSGTGDAALTAVDGAISLGSSLINVAGANLILVTTEVAGNNTAGDRNIQIGTGGINASNTNVTLTSADDVIVDGAINAASVTATAGDGKHASGFNLSSGSLNQRFAGNAGERGGDIIVNQTITSQTGDINLTAGDGGAGAQGEDATFPDQGGDGGAGGRGGNVVIVAALNSAQDVLLTSGEGGVGNNGGDGEVTGGIGGGTGGRGGDAGDITLTSTITATNNINLTTVRGGDSGAGGEVFISTTTGGTGGDTGDGGDIQLAGLINSTSGNISLNAGFQGRFNTIIGGGSGAAGTAGSLGKITGSDIDVRATNGSVAIGGEINPDLNADVTLLAGTQTGHTLSITGNPIPGGGGAAAPTNDINLTGSGNLTLQGFGFTYDKNISTETGNININSGDGALSLTSTLSSTNGDVSLASGDVLTVTGAINAINGDVDLSSVNDLNVSQLITANNVGLIASGMNAAIGNSTIIRTDTTGLITANASTGTGGISLLKAGDFDISNDINFNAGMGNVELEAVDGKLFTDSTTLNVNAANLTLKTAEANNNNTLDDQSITINSGGINATNTNITLVSADDVIINGAINAASVTATAGISRVSSGTFDDPSTTTTAQTGNPGVRGGDVVINQTVTTQTGDINLTAGRGGVGAQGQDGDSNNQGGNGGAGGLGGSIFIAADVNSAQDIILTSGEGGAGLDGGVGGSQSLGVGGGIGGAGGQSGDINVTGSVAATRNINLTTARGGDSGAGGDALIGSSGSDGDTGDSGDLQLAGLINSTSGDVTLDTGPTGRFGGGFGGPGAIGSVGKITGSDINVRADAGDIDVNAEVAADTNGNVTLVAGNTLSFAALQDINLTGTGNLTLQSNGFNSSNNFTTQDGDISINSGNSNITLSGTVNSGNGDLSVTAGGFFNTSTLSGNDITLTHTGNPFTSGLQKDAGGAAVEIQAIGKLNVDNANGSAAIINQTGDLQIGTLTGGNAFGLSGGSSSIALTVQDGDLNMDNTSSITNYTNINFTAHNGSIDTGTASITVAFSEATPSVIHSGVMTLITTEDTAGDHNITIGSGGINDGSITLSSTDDVVVNGAINSDGFSATSGNGAFGVFTSGQNGSDGERGGNININSSIQTNAGAINLTAGKGGDGSRTDVNGGVAGHGGVGGSIIVNGALTANQDLSQSSVGAITVNAGDGGRGAGSIDLGITTTAGNGGQGGDINITGDVTSNIDISLQSGDGQHGGEGSDISGVGGVGGSGGNIDVQGKLAAQQDINVTSGNGGAGGVGTINASTDGAGGNGGNAGNITLRDTVTAQRHVGLRTNIGGDGGDGRSGGGMVGSGTGGNGGNGGVMDLRGAISGQGDVQLIVSDAGDGGSGNVDGTVGSKGQIIGSLINATASTGALTLDGVINANSGVDVQLVAGTDLTINTGAEINATGAGNIILAAGGNFHNDSGASTPMGAPLTSNPISVDTGRFLIYSTRPDNNRDDIGTDFNAIANNFAGDYFVQYNTSFDANDPLSGSLPAGNGFVYSVQPVLTGVAVTVNPQTINYGDTISSILDTDFTVGGGAGATYEVNSSTLNATQIAQFELADPGTVTINGSDVELNLANTVNISNAGFAAAGSYTGGIEAGVIAGSALASQGIALSGSGDLTVNKINLDVTVAADNKVYDATDNAVLSLGTDNRLVGDLLSIDAGTSTFDDKNVGTGKTVTVAGASLSGIDAGNYNLNITNGGTLSADITKADLIVNNAAAQNKVYDRTTTAAVTGAAVTALLTDTVNLNLDSANFDNKNVGTNKAVTANYSINGTDAGNYNLIQPTGLTADVTQRTLNATLTANDKVYDATTAVTGSFGDDRIGGDVLTISGISSFDSKNVGTNKTVSTTGLNLSGTDALNYVLASTTVNDTADITQADLIVNGAAAQNKVYDATTSVTVTGGIVAALGSDVVTVGLASANFDNKNVGVGKTVNTNFTLTGIDATNYNVVQPTTLTADVTAADLIVNGGVAQNKVYDATIAATVTGATVTALASDVVTLGVANANFDNKNVGAGKAVTTNFMLSGTDAGNYNVVQPTTLTADVTAADLIVNGAIAQNKVYDATTTAMVTGASVTALASDAVTLGVANANFDTKDVGTGKAVTTNFTLSGVDASNYNVIQPTTVTADITQAALNITANADSKVFDGLAYSGGNGVSYAGFVGGENQSVLTGTASFSGTSQGAANPGSYVITPGGLSSGNYDLAFIDGDLTINAATIGGSGSGGSGTSGGNGPNGTFNGFQSQQNNNVNIPNPSGNFVPPGSGGGAQFPLRQGINNGSTPFSTLSWAASRSFQTGGNNNDEDDE